MCVFNGKFFAICTAVGVAVGVATGDMPQWLSIGVAVGLVADRVAVKGKGADRCIKP